jgi:hypothetical protein
LTCIDHRSLLVSTEGSGDVYRLDHLRGRLRPTLEFSPHPAIRRMVGSQPAYVIAAYNNFETVEVGGVRRQLFGIEWNYGSCPANRICAPSSFDAAACFGVRTNGRYTLRCLGGRDFAPSRRQASPVRSGQAFVAIRTFERSPFDRRRLYYGGYDCNFHPADGAAWIGTSTLKGLGL